MVDPKVLRHAESSESEKGVSSFQRFLVHFFAWKFYASDLKH